MKIISRELENKNNIDFFYTKDFLIPCYVYKIPIEVTRNRNLNFLEETILKLIQIDISLKEDSVYLSKKLGLYSEEQLIDRTGIVNLALKKLKDLRLDTPQLEESTSEVLIYQFFQEAYTNTLLPIVIKESNTYTYAKNINEIDEYSSEVVFQKNISTKKAIKAILINRYEEACKSLPTTEDFITTIHRHNFNKYKGSHLIDFKEIDLDLLNPELIFLHTKLSIIESNTSQFVVTNGFTNDFSTVLRQIINSKFSPVVQHLRKEGSRQIERKNLYITIPFISSKNKGKFLEEKKLINSIEEHSTVLNHKDSAKEQVENSKDKLIRAIYDLNELLFKHLAKEYDYKESFKDKSLLESKAEKIGFKLESKSLQVLAVSGMDNLQLALAKCLFNEEQNLILIASKFPNLVVDLNFLLKLRNQVKHSEKDRAVSQIHEDKLLKYKETAYKLVEMILNFQRKVVDQDYLDEDYSLQKNNALIDFEREIEYDIRSKFPIEIKDYVIDINYFLSLDFENQRYDIVKNTINNLYSSFEFILRALNQIRINTDIIPTKQKLFSVINKYFKIGSSLNSVNEKNINKAFKNYDASLGAYMLVYLYNNHTAKDEFVSLIENILSKRKHGVYTIEEVQGITLKELKILKSLSLKYIQKLVSKF